MSGDAQSKKLNRTNGKHYFEGVHDLKPSQKVIGVVYFAKSDAKVLFDTVGAAEHYKSEGYPLRLATEEDRLSSANRDDFDPIT